MTGERRMSLEGAGRSLSHYNLLILLDFWELARHEPGTSV